MNIFKEDVVFENGSFLKLLYKFMKTYKTYNPLSIVIIVLFISACQTQPNEKVDNNGVVTYELSYGLYTYGGEKLDDIRKGQDITLLFPVVNGAAFGNITDNFLQIVQVSPKEKFSLELFTDYSDIAKTFQQSGLSIAPENTQVMRLGTFHSYPNYKDKLGGGGFVDTTNQEALMLIYFSQPSKLTGVSKVRDDIYEFDIDIKAKGWAWVKSSEYEKNKYKVSRYQGSLNTIKFKAILRNVTAT